MFSMIILQVVIIIHSYNSMIVHISTLRSTTVSRALFWRGLYDMVWVLLTPRLGPSEVFRRAKGLAQSNKRTHRALMVSTHSLRNGHRRCRQAPEYDYDTWYQICYEALVFSITRYLLMQADRYLVTN